MQIVASILECVHGGPPETTHTGSTFADLPNDPVLSFRALLVHEVDPACRNGQVARIGFPEIVRDRALRKQAVVSETEEIIFRDLDIELDGRGGGGGGGCECEKWKEDCIQLLVSISRVVWYLLRVL